MFTSQWVFNGSDPNTRVFVCARARASHSGGTGSSKAVDGTVCSAIGSQIVGRLHHNTDEFMGTLFKLQTPEVLALAEQFPLALSARKKRLGFSSGLVRSGGEVIWAIIQWEQTWAEQIRHDLDWLAQWCPGNLPPVSEAGWPLWWHLLAKGTWFKQQTKHAVKACWKLLSMQAATVCFLADLHNRRYGVTASFGTIVVWTSDERFSEL